MAGDVLMTTTAGADTARIEDPVELAGQAPGDTDQATAPAPRDGAPERAQAPARPHGQERQENGSAAQPSAAPPGVGVRRRLARLGAQRGPGVNPVLEPLMKTIRATHPKADVRTVERAYDVAAHWHRDQKQHASHAPPCCSAAAARPRLSDRACCNPPAS